MQDKLMMTVIEFDDELFLRPAMKSWDEQVYFVRDNVIVGIGRMVSGTMVSDLYMDVVVIPEDDAAKEMFKDDHALQLLGRHGGLKYDGVSGQPKKNFSDDEPGRHMGTRIVGKVSCDNGFLHDKLKVQ